MLAVFLMRQRKGKASFLLQLVYMHSRKENIISAFKKPLFTLFFQTSLDFTSSCQPCLLWGGFVSILSAFLQLQGVFSTRTLRSPHVLLDGLSNPSEPRPQHRNHPLIPRAALKPLGKGLVLRYLHH